MTLALGLKGFQARLRTVIANKSVNAFAKRAGVSEGAIRKYLRGESLPGLDTLYALASGAGVDPGWLATGEGPWPQAPFSNQRHLLVPHITTMRTYDTGNITVSYGPISIDPVWVQSITGSKSNCIAYFQMAGDSMDPALRDGSLLLVDASCNSGPIDAIYVVQAGHLVMAKRIQFLMDGAMVLTSDNPKYPPQQLLIGDDLEVTLLGRVVWVGHRV